MPLTSKTACYSSDENEAVTIGGYSTRTQVFDLSVTYDTTKHTPTNVAYTASSGITTITVPNHGFSNGDQIKLRTNSIVFKCDKDNYATEHRYPRPTDPADTFLTIGNVTTNTFRINVGASPSGQQYNHVFVSSELASVERKLLPRPLHNVQTLPQRFIHWLVLLLLQLFLLQFHQEL